MHTLIHAHPLLTHKANISFLHDKEREKKKGNHATHLNCGFDSIPIFISFTRELHSSQYHWAACRFSHFAACTLRQMRAEEVHVFHICTGKSKAAEKLSEAQKLLRQKERGGKKKQEYSVPELLTTTCMCPPVVSKIVHTKSRHPGGIKTNPKIIFEKWRRKYSLKEQITD